MYRRKISGGVTGAIEAGGVYDAMLPRNPEESEHHILTGDRPVLVLQNKKDIRGELKVVVAKMTFNDFLLGRPYCMGIPMPTRDGRTGLSVILLNEIVTIPKAWLTELRYVLTEEEKDRVRTILSRTLAMEGDKDG